MKALLIATITTAMAFPVLAGTEVAPTTTTKVTAPQGAAIESTTTTTVPQGATIESTTTTKSSTAQSMEENAAPKDEPTAPLLDDAGTKYNQQRMDEAGDFDSDEQDEFFPNRMNNLEDDESEDGF